MAFWGGMCHQGVVGTLVSPPFCRVGWGMMDVVAMLVQVQHRILPLLGCYPLKTKIISAIALKYQLKKCILLFPNENLLSFRKLKNQYDDCFAHCRMLLFPAWVIMISLCLTCGKGD